MQKKTKQEINARYRKKLSAIALLEKSRDGLTKKELLDLTEVNLQEARDWGLDISVSYDKATDLYTITITGEGEVQCTIRRLPTLVNGLRVMGKNVRALYFEKKLKSKTK
ncbi:MAG: hypothetical protein LUC16_02185 [Coprobacillus sp.]|nr:hypothetical protein [Coprobacillus sp.]